MLRATLMLSLAGLGESFLQQPLMQRPVAHRRAFQHITMADVAVGSQVIAMNPWNSSSPEYGIVRAQSYELQRVYFQGIGSDGEVRRVDVKSLEAKAPADCAGFTKYLVLFSRRYHDNTGPVIVRPNEVELVTVKDEITASAWLALPGLFWVWLAYTIYQYGESHGGIFSVFSKSSL